MFIKPIQLGPIREAPTSLILCSICSSNRPPSGVSSPKPAEITMKALTFFCLAKISTTLGQAGLGIARIAISVSGISSTER